MPAYPKLKLTYFNIKARAEPIRLALSISGIPFEDERISGDWAARKSTMTFHQVPVLTVDDKTVIAQSTAILRYVGTLGEKRLYPADGLHAALVDQIISQIQDVEASMRPSGAEQDSAKKIAMRAELAAKTFPMLFGDLDKFIGENGGKYSTGNEVRNDIYLDINWGLMKLFFCFCVLFFFGKITIADLFLYQCNTSYSAGAYDGIPKDVLSFYPNIQKVVAAVKAHPAVAAWESKTA